MIQQGFIEADNNVFFEVYTGWMYTSVVTDLDKHEILHDGTEKKWVNSFGYNEVGISSGRESGKKAGELGFEREVPLNFPAHSTP
jgi:hypothetical protein